jgi:hypothetical protein
MFMTRHIAELDKRSGFCFLVMHLESLVLSGEKMLRQIYHRQKRRIRMSGKKKVGLFFCVAVFLTAMVWSYDEGPKGSGNWVYGKITYGDGSKCENCCQIVIETSSGFSEEGCSNSDAEYKINVASKWVQAVYYRGSKVWDGDRSAEGGLRIDIRAK